MLLTSAQKHRQDRWMRAAADSTTIDPWENQEWPLWAQEFNSSWQAFAYLLQGTKGQTEE